MLVTYLLFWSIELPLEFQGACHWVKKQLIRRLSLSCADAQKQIGFGGKANFNYHLSWLLTLILNLNLPAKQQHAIFRV